MQLELTTLAMVKLMRAITGSDQDALLSQLIGEVSEEAERYLRRHTLQTQRTEIYDIAVNQRILTLDGYPISKSSAFSIQYSDSRDFSSVATLESSHYKIISTDGQIEFDGIDTSFDPGYVQITYTGGMAVDTDAFVAAYRRISGACAREVVNRFNRAKAPEGSLKAMGNGNSVGYEKPLESLKDFYTALDHDRRVTLL